MKKLFQLCEHCGLVEAKGFYCSRCFSRTQETWIFSKAPTNDALTRNRAKKQAERAQA